MYTMEEYVARYSESLLGPAGGLQLVWSNTDTQAIYIYIYIYIYMYVCIY